jgi:hypothetical protein
LPVIAKIKKPGHPFPGNPAIFPSLEETRGFPSPPHDGFGFITDEFFLNRDKNNKTLSKKSRNKYGKYLIELEVIISEAQCSSQYKSV